MTTINAPLWRKNPLILHDAVVPMPQRVDVNASIDDDAASVGVDAIGPVMKATDCMMSPMLNPNAIRRNGVVSFLGDVTIMMAMMVDAREDKLPIDICSMYETSNIFIRYFHLYE